ncbi:MAG: GH3 family domain-containing protein [Thainema sp.]
MQRLIIQLFGWLLSRLTRPFYQALDDPQQAQRRVQQEICDRIIHSPYGQTWGIQSIHDWDKLPIVDYDDLHDWILPTLNQRHNGLTPEPILFYEKTSGSRGAAKLIPYTQALRQSFSHMFCVWAQDLICNGPRFRTGKIYFCVSPQLGKTDEVALTLNSSPPELPLIHILNNSSKSRTDPPKSPLTRGNCEPVPPLLRGARGDHNVETKSKKFVCKQSTSRGTLSRFLQKSSEAIARLPFSRREKGLGDEGQPPQMGLSDDSEYLDQWLRWILSPFLVSPQGINRIQDAKTFKHQLCRTLLAEERLEIISIWSPSFLKVHLDWMQAHRDVLVKELCDRTSPQRLKLLNQTPIPWTKVWPELKLISCWDSASSADSANWLRQQFTGVLVQGKGLLATEAPMTIPLIQAQGFVPVLDQIFFEFEHETDAIYQLHELEVGQMYTIIISQKGGLYRYRIGDRVRVTHYFHKTPCLEFLGRSGAISDLVGEKLTEDFVREVLATLPMQTATFKTLTPVVPAVEGEAATPFYQLLVDQAKDTEPAIAAALDRALCQSPHYHHARLLGQLAPAQVIISATAADQFVQKQITSGKTWGDIKYPILNLPTIKTAGAERSASIDTTAQSCKESRRRH